MIDPIFWPLLFFGLGSICLGAGVFTALHAALLQNDRAQKLAMKLFFLGVFILLLSLYHAEGTSL